MKSLGNIVGAIIVFFIAYLVFNHLDSNNVSPSPEITQSTSQTSTTVVLPQTTEPESTSTTSTEIPPPLIQLSEAINKEIPSTEYITRNYSWIYQSEWTWEMETSKGW